MARSIYDIGRLPGIPNLITHVSPPMGEQRTELIAEIYVGASVEACAGQAFDCAAFSRMPAETHG